MSVFVLFVCAGRLQRTEEGSRPPGTGVSAGQELWVLGSEPRFSARVKSALNC